jgi:glycolate oxidase FAD binding subunit
MERVLEHDPGDLTCTVEAGVRLSALREILAATGQRLSLDPPGDPTIGALVALNASGPLRHRFGAPRDLVLGATLVLADGTVASAGGKVVKNVAGYDLARLVCGSLGRLAFVGRVSFRLHPLPRATGTFVVETEDSAAVAASLLASQLQPSALDVLHPGRVAVLFEGSERAVAAQLVTARALVGGGEADQGVWDESRARQAGAGGRVHFDPGELGETLASLSEAVVRPASGVAYTPDSVPRHSSSPGHERLVEAIRAQLDPRGVLAA